jgi:hypothetical protein
MCDGQCLQKDKPLTSHATPGWKYDRERQRAIIVMQTGRGCVRLTVRTETAPPQETRQGRREGSGCAKERQRHAKESRAEGEQQCDGQLPSVELQSVVGLGGCGKAQRRNASARWKSNLRSLAEPPSTTNKSRVKPSM